jgi:hypothetical protein
MNLTVADELFTRSCCTYLNLHCLFSTICHTLSYYSLYAFLGFTYCFLFHNRRVCSCPCQFNLNKIYLDVEFPFTRANIFAHFFVTLEVRNVTPTQFNNSKEKPMMLLTVLALSITVIMFIIFIILGAVILWVRRKRQGFCNEKKIHHSKHNLIW